MELRNKKVLITAGSTWVPIDSVRVISNIATGETGILLAEKFQKSGAKVTLLLGPVESCCLNKEIQLIRFKFFDELKDTLIKELELRRYDLLIHSAAVSDYQLSRVYSEKVKSGIKNWKLSLKPTAKIIGLIRKHHPSLAIVGFKFQPQAKKDKLIEAANKLMLDWRLNLVVACAINQGRYQAYMLNQNKKIFGPLDNKNSITSALIKAIGNNLCTN